MAGRLSGVASRIMGGNGVVSRSIGSSLLQRAGKHIVPDKPLPVNDDGTAFPEPCVDRIVDTVGKSEALGWLCEGLGFFATLGLAVVWNDRASKIPFDTPIFQPLGSAFCRISDLFCFIMLSYFGKQLLRFVWRCPNRFLSS